MDLRSTDATLPAFRLNDHLLEPEPVERDHGGT
jgi:hypothetical protein